MRKVLIWTLGLVVLIFILPAILTNKKILSTSSKENNEITEVEIEKYDYSQHSKIKLLHKKTEEVEELDLDEYIANVVSAEMPVKYNIEALKAQAIVARTYTM